MSWPELEALGAVATWHDRRLALEGPVEVHEAIRAAIYVRVPRLQLTSASLRVRRGSCDGCGLAIGRDKLGWCPLCIAAWVVVLRDRAKPVATRAA